jgi:hypothetical protein
LTDATALAIVFASMRPVASCSFSWVDIVTSQHLLVINLQSTVIVIDYEK